MKDFMTIMDERGFIHDRNFDLACPPEDIRAYIGFDLTAQSLHVGSLIQLMVLRWLQKTGHTPFALLGEATTKIGDPSGKDETRQMLSEEQIEANHDGIAAVIRQVVPDIDFLTNSDWFNGYGPSFMGFLEVYGPHFTINRMLTFDSVKSRLARQQPLTFLEFCYMLFQAVDFREARHRFGVNMQIGGSDQWGNIINGVEIIRRIDSKTAYAFTTPLLTDKEGKKMGKSQGRPIWLDSDLTPVFDFFQYWRNCDDADVWRFYKLFTEDTVESIDARAKACIEGVMDINDAKKRLAMLITTIVHGAAKAQEAFDQSVAIFENNDTSGLAAAITATGRAALVDLLVESGMATSKSAARRLIAGNAVSVDGEKVSDDTLFLDTDSIIKAGKKPPFKVEIKP
jgi:tyrosyl-tRNA synthetase